MPLYDVSVQVAVEDATISEDEVKQLAEEYETPLDPGLASPALTLAWQLSGSVDGSDKVEQQPGENPSRAN